MKKYNFNTGFTKIIRLLSVFMIFFTLIFISCNDEDSSIVIGSKAPEFTLSSSTGSEVKLSDYKNKVVVLFFLGNACPSCKAAAPSVESELVIPFMKRADYQVLGLDQWDGNASSVEAFKSSTGLSVPVLLNASATAKTYGTTYDRIVVIDKAGNVVFSGVQGVDADIAVVKKKVEALLEMSTQNPVVGNAPAFTLSSMVGGEEKLSDFQNKVVVLFFFGNSCPPCKAAAPSIESMLVTPYASRTDYKVLGLDQWNGNLASVQTFKTATNVTFPLLLNAATVAANYKTTYDRLVIIDKAGNISFTGSQGAANDIEAVKTRVNTLLGIQ